MRAGQRESFSVGSLGYSVPSVREKVEGSGSAAAVEPANNVDKSQALNRHFDQGQTHSIGDRLSEGSKRCGRVLLLS